MTAYEEATRKVIAAEKALGAWRFAFVTRCESEFGGIGRMTESEEAEYKRLIAALDEAESELHDAKCGAYGVHTPYGCYGNE